MTISDRIMQLELRIAAVNRAIASSDPGDCSWTTILTDMHLVETRDALVAERDQLLSAPYNAPSVIADATALSERLAA